MEIDRLVRLTGDQKRKIAELEYQITTDKGLLSAGDVPRHVRDSRRSTPPLVDLTKSPIKSKKSLAEKSSKSKTEHKKTCKKVSSTKQSVPEKKGTEVQESMPPLMMTKCCCEAGGCMKSMKELLDKEIDCRQAQVCF